MISSKSKFHVSLFEDKKSESDSYQSATDFILLPSVALSVVSFRSGRADFFLRKNIFEDGGEVSILHSASLDGVKSAE